MNQKDVYTCLSYDVASKSVIKLCIKNDNPLVDEICKLRRKVMSSKKNVAFSKVEITTF